MSVPPQFLAAGRPVRNASAKQKTKLIVGFWKHLITPPQYWCAAVDYTQPINKRADRGSSRSHGAFSNETSIQPTKRLWRLPLPDRTREKVLDIRMYRRFAVPSHVRPYLAYGVRAYAIAVFRHSTEESWCVLSENAEQPGCCLLKTWNHLSPVWGPDQPSPIRWQLTQRWTAGLPQHTKHL